MPQDPKRRQKALLKQRRKHKAAAAARQRSPGQEVATPHTIVRRARTFPILECLISPDWQSGASGLVQIVVAREQPTEEITFGVYLVDMYCLGLKNTYCNAGFSRSRYQQEVKERVFHGVTPRTCQPELAHQMIYGAIAYAAQFGFKPQKDFELSQYLLAPRGELEEPFTLTFGKDGKPFYVSGPYDNVPAILTRLEKTAGPGNYDYLVGVEGD